MAFMKRKSVLPIYLVGVTWLVWAVFLPLYRPAHYIMAALASAIVYFVGKMIWPDRGYVLKNGEIVMSDSGKNLLKNDSIRAAYLGENVYKEK